MKAFAAFVGILLLATPAIAPAQDAWAATLTERPTDRQVEYFMWAAAGCLKDGPAVARLQGFEDCKTLPLPLPQGRRIVEMGIVSGGIYWCDEDQSLHTPERPWAATMAELRAPPEGGRWPGDLRRFVMTLHGIGQGWSSAGLQKSRGACMAADRATALSEMNARIARYRAGH